MSETRHDPTPCTTGRHGSWITCTCGWRSSRWSGITGAHLEFGRHLRDAPAPSASRGQETTEAEEGR